MQYEDQILGLKHGDACVSIHNGKFAFFFRFGPVPRWGAWLGAVSHPKPGVQRNAYGTFRHPKTLNTLRWEEAHKLEGIKTRKRADHPPTAWDDYYGHADKNWKRHRRTQWKSRR